MEVTPLSLLVFTCSHISEHERLAKYAVIVNRYKQSPFLIRLSIHKLPVRTFVVRNNLRRTIGRLFMKIKVVIHTAEEGGFWAEVPAIPGCVTQGETYGDLMTNLHEAIEGCLSVDTSDFETTDVVQVVEIAV